MAENTINAQNSNLDAARDIELVGGNQVKIANTTHNLNLFQIPSENNISDLFSILDKNRISLNSNLTEIKKHFLAGGDLLHNYVQARIVDTISESRIIESLILAIKSKGGDAHTLPEEVNIIARIEGIIANGKVEYQQYLERKKAEEDERRFQENLGCFLGILNAIGNGFVWLYNQIAGKNTSTNQLPNNSNELPNNTNNKTE